MLTNINNGQIDIDESLYKALRYNNQKQYINSIKFLNQKITVTIR